MKKLTAVISLFLFCSLALSGCAGPATNTNTPPPATTNGNRQPAPATPAATAPAPLPDSGYKVAWGTHNIPSQMETGKRQTVSVTLKNTSQSTWPTTIVGNNAANAVTLGYHWLPAKGDEAVVFDGVRTILPQDVAPGQTVTLNNVTIEPPARPGSYRLQVSLVQEAVAWFEKKGASTLTLPVTVR